MITYWPICRTSGWINLRLWKDWSVGDLKNMGSWGSNTNWSYRRLFGWIKLYLNRERFSQKTMMWENLRHCKVGGKTLATAWNKTEIFGHLTDGSIVGAIVGCGVVGEIVGLSDGAFFWREREKSEFCQCIIRGIIDVCNSKGLSSSSF